MSEKVRIVIQGFGFMGRVHARCYAANPLAEVAGIIDLQPEKAEAAWRDLGFAPVPVAESLADLLAETKADILDICLPTDAHPESAEAGFGAGLHVFCEKPIALDLEAAARITGAAEKSGRQLMIGHCLRFWPEYLALKEMIDSGEAGGLRALDLFRRSPRPGYTAGDWTGDPQRCLGAALDLHIHDTDLVYFLVGAPRGVHSRGMRLPTGWDHIQTQYLFDETMVQAEGGWAYPQNRPFQMGYCALFENGSLDFDNTAPEPLRKNVGGEISLPVRSDSKPANNLAGLEGYQNQLDDFVGKIARGQPVTVNTGADATASLRTLLAELQSAETGKRVTLHS